MRSFKYISSLIFWLTTSMVVGQDHYGTPPALTNWKDVERTASVEIEDTRSYNWSAIKAYGSDGVTPIAISKSFFDNMGGIIQAQEKKVETQDIFITEIERDVFGREVLTTSPAKSQDPNGYLIFDNNFNPNYDYTIFDNNTPPAVSTSGTLGEYYNIDALDPDDAEEPSATDFPYSRVEYYKDPRGVVKRGSGPDVLRIGGGKETFHFQALSGGELDYLFGYDRMNRLGSGDFGNFEPVPNPSFIVQKDITVDAEGLTSIAYTDNRGNLVASCLSGSGNSCQPLVARSYICHYKRDYVDIHVPSSKLNTLSIDIERGCEPVFPDDMSDDPKEFRLTKCGKLSIYDLQEEKNLRFKYDFSTGKVTFENDVLTAGKQRFLRITFDIHDQIVNDCDQMFEDTKVEYELDYTDWSIYFYDARGSVQRVIPPEGIDCSSDLSIVSYKDEEYEPGDCFNKKFYPEAPATYIDELFYEAFMKARYGLQDDLYRVECSVTGGGVEVQAQFKVATIGEVYQSLKGDKFIGEDPGLVQNPGQLDRDIGVSPRPIGEIEFNEKFIEQNPNAAFIMRRRLEVLYGDGLSPRDNGGIIPLVKPTPIIDRDGTGNDGRLPDVVIAKIPFTGSVYFSVDYPITITFSNSSENKSKAISAGYILSMKADIYKDQLESIEIIPNTAIIPPKQYSSIESGFLPTSIIGTGGEKTFNFTTTGFDFNVRKKITDEVKRRLDFSIFGNGTFGGVKRPNHTLEEEYEYGADKQTIRSIGSDNSKDESQRIFVNGKWVTIGIDEHTEYVYTKDGRIRFSQNPEQKEAGTNSNLGGSVFSYTNYDRLGRVIETGEYDYRYSNTNYPFVKYPLTFQKQYDNPANLENPFHRSVLDIVELEDGLDDRRCKEQVYFAYDFPTNDLPVAFSGFKQTYVLGRLSKSWNANSTSWYSYDSKGRLRWHIQDIQGLGAKLMEYEYDYFGNVTKVKYQTNGFNADRIVHRYEYDASQRLTKAYASGVSPEMEIASYEYYEYGPLKRMVLGKNLQGIDYTYGTLGQLKAINHPSLDPAKDPGLDGAYNTDIAPDVFGMTLDYYSNDYNKDGSVFKSGETTGDKYNGLVKSMRWRRKGETVQWMYAYNYDYRNQLSQADHGIFDGSNTFTNGQNYNLSGLSYDKNGNILSLTRDYDKIGGDLSDNFVYDYVLRDGSGNPIRKTNRLVGVQNNSSAFKSYKYDRLGQMIAEVQSANGNDLARDFYVKYDVYGKVTGVYATSTFSLPDNILSDPIVEFVYNERGDRVAKKSYKADHTLNYTTYYVRDNAGSVIAIYDDNNLQKQVRVTERPLYGAGRIGRLYGRFGTTTSYEIKDHLGNIRATIEKVPGTYSQIHNATFGAPPNNYFTYSGATLVIEDATSFGVFFEDGEVASGKSFSIEKGENYRLTINYSSSAGALKVYLNDGMLKKLLGELPIKASLGTEILNFEYKGTGTSNAYISLENESGVQTTFVTNNIQVLQAAPGTTFLSYSDYFPFGMKFNKMTSSFGDRHDYQGDYSEKDEETGWNAFQLRMYDSRIGRWLSVDPKSQYNSLYVAMGNNLVSLSDPTGGEASPIYDDNGTYLGTDADGFQGEIIIMSSEEFYALSAQGENGFMDHETALNYGTSIADAELTSQALSNIYTHILSETPGVDISGIYGGAVSVYEGNVPGHQGYNNPDYVIRYNSNIEERKVNVNWIYQDELSSVEAVQSYLGVHEWEGHVILGYTDVNQKHHLIYQAQKSHPTFNQLPQDLQDEITERSDYEWHRGNYYQAQFR